MTLKTTSIISLALALLLAGCGASDDAGLIPPPQLAQKQAQNTPQPEAEPSVSKKLETAPPPKPVSAMTDSKMPDKIPTATLNHISVRQDYFPVRRCMNMGNALEAEVEGEWGYTIEARHFRAIAEAGMDTVRLPIRWAAHTETSPPYKINSAFIARIDEVVSQAQAAGLGVIIDVHHYEKLMENVPGETPRFLAIWEQIASHYQNAPANVYFEVLNEPIAPMTMAQANALYTKVIPVIRRTNPVRPLIMGGDDWNSIDTLDSVVWPDDPYLVATFHDYGPYEFTHQGASWMESAPPIGRRWGKADDLRELSDTYDIARRFQKRTGLPVLVGEFGVIDTASHAERVRWLTTRRRTIEYAGMSWCAWDFAGAFKTYDVNRNAWMAGMKDALTGP